MPKTKFSKSELYEISMALKEKRMLPLNWAIIYPNFVLYTHNKKLWDMYLSSDKKVLRFSFITKHDIKERKLVDQLLKYFGKPDEKDSS